MSKTAGSPTRTPTSPVAIGPYGAQVSPPEARSIVVITGQLRAWRGDGKRWFRRACVLAIVLAGAWSVATGQGDAAPCEAHQGVAKDTCLIHWRRAHTAWPKHPSLTEVRNRMSRDEWDALRWICQHEQPGRGWNGCWWSAPYTSYVGGLGMAASTYGIGAAVTGYPYPPKATAAEQMAVGVIVMRKFGPSAWDSWGSR